MFSGLYAARKRVMKSLIISAGIKKAGQLLLSAALAVTVVGAFGTTVLVAYFTSDFVAYFTSCSSASAGSQTMFDQMPLDSAISTLGNLWPA